MEKLIIEPIELPKEPIEFHPEFIRRDGMDYVLLPKEEFLLAIKHLEDYEDHYAIEEAKRESAGLPTIAYDELRKELGLE
jgi:hypothetical protein